MPWVFFALTATFAWALANILDKVLRTKYLKDSIALTASFGLYSTILSFILLLFIGIPSIPILHSAAAFTAGVLLVLGFILYLKALSIEEASRVIPLWHLSPIFTLILAVIFLNEILTPLKYAAFASICLGGILISTRKSGNTFHLSPAISLMLLSSLFVAVSDVLIKFAYTTGIFWQTFFMVYFGGSIGSLALFIFPNARKNVLRAFISYKHIIALILLLDVLLGLSGQVFFNKAISLGPVTLVSVFISFQSLFVLLIAAFLSAKFPLFIKEAIDAKTIGTKLLAIILMAFGLYLLVM